MGPPTPRSVPRSQTRELAARLVLGENGGRPTLRLSPMAALDLADIPSNINTFERLAVWAVQCLQSVANGEEVNVVAGASSVPISQCQIAVTADNVDRFILTAYVPLNRAALNDPVGKTWMAALDISAAQPHANQLSN